MAPHRTPFSQASAFALGRPPALPFLSSGCCFNDTPRRFRWFQSHQKQPTFSLLSGFAGCLFILSLLFSSIGTAAELMPATDLEKDGQIALQKNQPIALLLVYDGLRSTTDLKEEALLPYLQSGQFDGKVLFREIAVNQEGTVTDFYGESLPKSEYQTLFNITSLPAMVFVDGDGTPLTSPLFSGAYEFYGHYLKRKLNESMQALGNDTRFE